MPPARTQRKKPSRDLSSKPRRAKILIFGPYGHGKTHLLGTAVFDERTCPILIADFDGGVEDVLFGIPGYGTDIVVEQCRSMSDFNSIYERLVSNDEGFKAGGIDTLSEVHTSALMDIIDTKGTTRSNPDLIQQDDYGAGLVQLRRLVRKFKDLPIHMFYTAHSKEEVDAREGLVKMPKLYGQAAMEIPGLMSAVTYLAIGTERTEDGPRTFRSLLLQNHPKVRAKVRTQWGVEAPDEIDDPTITALLDALHYSE